MFHSILLDCVVVLLAIIAVANVIALYILMNKDK